MKIKSAEFVISETRAGRFASDGRFEIALIGRSNVGKSSFINAMLGRRSLARTSSQPGKTRTINFYLVNDAFFFVDLPGYGYAKASKEQKAEFDSMIKDYLLKRQADFIVFQLVDYRIGATESDLAAYRLLQNAGITPIVILTKEDKLKTSEKTANLNKVRSALGRSEGIFPFSTQKPRLISQVWAFLDEILSDNVYRE